MRTLTLAAAAAAGLAISACGITRVSAKPGQIVAIGAENEYANVISQIGGRYVKTDAVMSNPNTDPHTFEASPSVAADVSQAQLVVQNGLGYDDFMSKIEAASPNSKRKVLNVQHTLGLPDSTPNPHLWYSPGYITRAAVGIASDLSALQPSHASYFQANLRRFKQSLAPLQHAISAFARQHPATPVATTEPVADYLLTAAGTHNLTPFTFQADVMNGVDPAPQAIKAQNSLLSGRKVKVFVYNQQVTDTMTQGFLKLASQHHVPEVGVYETMPTGYNYQSWMLAELKAMNRAVVTGRSTARL
ncbi:MAG: zinc ABC transporter substrate-binding protein [Solirubrobacterales bacterium]|nr:zinc ABC transporter substrate-binding protein [Solirubrobacterales bacterium]